MDYIELIKFWKLWFGLGAMVRLSGNDIVAEVSAAPSADYLPEQWTFITITNVDVALHLQTRV